MPPSDTPAISIVIPAFNSSQFILETISSVTAQDYSSWELLLVDDGSSDDTTSIVSGLDDRIHVISQRNAGIAAARNTGIRHAKGRYIAFLDHDDYWHPKKLKSQIEVMECNPHVGVVYGEFTRWDPSQPAQFQSEEIDTSQIDALHSGWIYHLLLQTNWVLFSTALFRREVFDVVGIFNPTLPPADDWDMAVRTSRHFQFIKLAQPVTLYRIHPDQTSRRAVKKNHEAEFRANTIAQYGLTGPDGSRVDARELRRRQFRAHLSHGILHLEAGNVDIARESLVKALRIRPYAAKAWLKYATSLFAGTNG